MVRRNTKRLLKLLASLALLTSSLMLLMRAAQGPSLLDDMFLEGPPTPKEPERKDWHDYARAEAEAAQRGPGEQGQPYALPTGTSQKLRDQLFRSNGFNALLSDHIALNRSLPDIRHPGCRSRTYLSQLPRASVVIPFHNEHRATLLRTVTSVVDRSPPGLVAEIVLVDDFSDLEDLQESLDIYVRENFPDKVRVLRAEKREGLIRARLLGARAVQGDVIVFLDSHTEANVNWLPPLLEPIAKDKRVVVCPFIDVIDFETFGYRAQDEGARGAFDWELYYKRLPLLPEDLKNPTEPFKSPVMAGGLFAIHRELFWELGGYDPGLEVWGGEQYELSFKIWQCGGSMVDAPCSRVGHVYRKFAPFPNPGLGDFVGRNYKRVAEVWMDEYKEYVYLRRAHYRALDPGDLSKQRALRERLHCKPFSWFLEVVAFDLPRRYPPVEPPDFAQGEIRNVGCDRCVDAKFRSQTERVGLGKCTTDQSAEQQFVLTWHRDIRPAKRTVCLDVSSPELRAPVMLWNCHGMQGNQLWKYDLAHQSLVHPITGNCLDCDTKTFELFMSPCQRDLSTQRWRFGAVNASALQAQW